LGDEIARAFGQVCDVADGAGAWAFGGAEGLAHQIGQVGGLAALGLGRLNKHTGHRINPHASHVKCNNPLLLATFSGDLLEMATTYVKTIRNLGWGEGEPHANCIVPV
jgi:hypothetical protein